MAKRAVAVLFGLTIFPIAAQAGDLKSQILGVYSLAAVYDQLADGTKHDTWGSGVQGNLIFTPSGHFSVTIAAANRASAPTQTPRDPIGPVISYYGTYTVDEADKTITYHIQQSTFPRWNDFERKTTVEKISDTELDTLAPVKGDPKLGDFIAHLQWKREAQ